MPSTGLPPNRLPDRFRQDTPSFQDERATVAEVVHRGPVEPVRTAHRAPVGTRHHLKEQKPRATNAATRG